MTLDPDISAAIRRAAIAVVVLFLGVVILGIVFREPLEAAGTSLVERFGYFGIATGILLADMFTFPLPADVYLLIGIAGGAEPIWIIVVGSAASVIGGMGAYQIGRWLGATRWLAPRISQLRTTYEPLIRKLGVVTVIIAALTPLPFSVVSMLAGSLRLPFKLFVLASLFRVPRIAGYFLLIYLGWNV